VKRLAPGAVNDAGSNPGSTGKTSTSTSTVTSHHNRINRHRQRTQ
jgi:hypothetical protein